MLKWYLVAMGWLLVVESFILFGVLNFEGERKGFGLDSWI